MNKPILLAAAIASLPLCAGAQQGKPAGAPDSAPESRCVPAAEPAPRASSALPARVTTRPEPQLGKVAPATRVPSHADTPSSRAMQAATDKAAGRGADATNNGGAGCPPAGDRDAQGPRKQG